MATVRERPAVVYVPSTSSPEAAPRGAQRTGADGDTLRFDSFAAAERARRDAKLPADAVVMRSQTSNAGGAYFYKLSTQPTAAHHGIRVEGTLPEIAFDPKRHVVFDGNKSETGPADLVARTLADEPDLGKALAQLDDYRTGPLDRPSVYLGGHAKHEADVGLSWDRVRDAQGRAIFTDLPDGSDMNQPAHRFHVETKDGVRRLMDGTGAVLAEGDDAVRAAMVDRKLQPSFAFRPYWRTQPGNDWQNPPVTADKWKGEGDAPPNLYFYPGERFAMNVQEAGKGKLRLDVRSLDDAGKHTHVTFGAPGFGEGTPTAWKRVSSIDQFHAEDAGGGRIKRVGNEGRSVIPTATTALGGAFSATQVLVGESRTPRSIYEVAAPTQVRGKDLSDPARYDRIFDVDVDGRGGEHISIDPRRR